MNIGLLGGSFNPPHLGHIHISKVAHKSLQLDKVWWVVSPQNPLKSKNILGSFDERVEKSREITRAHNFIEVTSIERDLFKSQNQFYTYKLLDRLRALYPKHKFHLIIGADNLVSFHKWKNYKHILQNFDICVIDRGEDKYKALSSKAYQFGRRFGNISFVNYEKMDISSTQIRNQSL